MPFNYHFPQVRGSSFRPAYEHIAWEDDAGAYAAWCEGRTGYPVVDAAMRQMVETGWMHNRAHMIIASFLVKEPLIDWRWGKRFFMQHLVDGNPAGNNGGWQWTAGTGTDAGPYFRIFNPVLQGKKDDPGGSFVRRWLPGLARVPDKFIHYDYVSSQGTVSLSLDTYRRFWNDDALTAVSLQLVPGADADAVVRDL